MADCISSCLQFFPSVNGGLPVWSCRGGWSVLFPPSWAHCSVQYCRVLGPYQLGGKSANEFVYKFGSSNRNRSLCLKVPGVRRVKTIVDTCKPSHPRQRLSGLSATKMGASLYARSWTLTSVIPPT